MTWRQQIFLAEAITTLYIINLRDLAPERFCLPRHWQFGRAPPVCFVPAGPAFSSCLELSKSAPKRARQIKLNPKDANNREYKVNSLEIMEQQKVTWATIQQPRIPKENSVCPSSFALALQNSLRDECSELAKPQRCQTVHSQRWSKFKTARKPTFYAGKPFQVLRSSGLRCMSKSISLAGQVHAAKRVLTLAPSSMGYTFSWEQLAPL